MERIIEGSVIGGEYDGDRLDSVEIFDPKTNSWTAGVDLPETELTGGKKRVHVCNLGLSKPRSLPPPPTENRASGPAHQAGAAQSRREPTARHPRTTHMPTPVPMLANPRAPHGRH